MTYSEKFNLLWREFENCASNTFRELFEETTFVDVTLVSDDLKQMKAHKVILSACSSVLREILRLNPQKHPIIYLSGISYKEMQSLISFVYLGQTEIEQSDLEHFLIAAAKLDVKGLNQGMKDEKCKYYMGKNSKNEDNDFPENSESMDTKDIVTFEKEHIGDTDIDDDTTELTVKNSETNIYNCEQCDFKSSFPHSVKRHKNSVHDGVTFPCEFCNYKSSFSTNLVRHKKRVHQLQ